MVLKYQGRFGAAVHALQDAVNGYRNIGDRSADMAGLLNDLADALVQSGRAAEAEPLVQEAESLVQNLKNDSMKAQLLVTRGDIRRYSGDAKSAERLYQQALQAALHGNAPEQVLICRLHVAEVAANKSNPDVFRTLTQQADSRNLKYLSLESSLDTAEALIARRDYAAAEQELQAASAKSEKLGSRFETARIHYLLGTALTASAKQSDASQQYGIVLKLIEDMQKDPGAEQLLQRSDVNSMFAEASRLARAGN
jgi:tetratricopeptide (TPR) repeat protein